MNAIEKSLNSKMKFLVVDDEDEVRQVLLDQLHASGSEAMGLASGDGILSYLESFSPAVILLDQKMPGKTGSQVISEIRSHPKHSEVPIMMVSGNGSEEEKVAALNLGADDYVTKPYAINELIARANALVRRSKATHKEVQQNLSYKDLYIDFVAHKATLNGAELALTLTEFKILAELLRQSGKVLTRDRLRERALGNFNVTDRTIDVHMASLRKKLEHMGDLIETVRGVGYRLSV